MTQPTAKGNGSQDSLTSDTLQWHEVDGQYILHTFSGLSEVIGSNNNIKITTKIEEGN